MSSLIIRVAAGIAVSLTPLLLASCGSTHSDKAHPTSGIIDNPVISGEPAAYSNVDVGFANSLIPCEDQAFNVAQLAPDHSTNAELAAFAAKTAASLTVDTQVLKALQAQWKDLSDSHMGGGGPGITTSFTIDDAMLPRLNSLHGPDFDAPWLESMMSLDRSAIEIANAEIGKGKNQDAIGLAKQVVKARQAEIGQIQQLQQTSAG